MPMPSGTLGSTEVMQEPPSAWVLQLTPNSSATNSMGLLQGLKTTFLLLNFWNLGISYNNSNLGLSKKDLHS